jgi:hypothetical protein
MYVFTLHARFIFFVSFHVLLFLSFLNLFYFFLSIFLLASPPFSQLYLLNFSSSAVRFWHKAMVFELHTMASLWFSKDFVATSSFNCTKNNCVLSFLVLKSKYYSSLSIIFIKISKMQESKQVISRPFKITITRI